MLNWGERGHVLATCDRAVVYCRIVGVANMNNSAPFEAFTREKQDGGYREFILDFSGCEGLDSTFLGIVLGLRLGRGGDAEPPHVTAVNLSETVRKTLAEVGIDRLIEVVPRPVQLPAIPMRRLERDCSEGERLGMILSAHESLCELGDENEQRFGAFVSLLRAELDRETEEDPRKNASRTRAAASEEDR